MNQKKIEKEVSRYYGDKLKTYGATPQGVDWNSEASQLLRFAQLLKILRTNDNNFSILDYGCGFGAMLKFMKERFDNFAYTGFDISEAMIEQAKKIYGNEPTWVSSLNDEMKFDYVIASGIFNVKLDNNNQQWLDYIEETINNFNHLAVKGFSFNILTGYSDKEFMKDYLCYADPLYLFDYCKKNFSRNVALLHDYDLYEFTLLIRK